MVITQKLYIALLKMAKAARFAKVQDDKILGLTL